ncbi:MAG: hypothetical protein HY278_08935, partial [candidate division NC10 bacterium]|nr:hypothetical protein [candidate division NC10 bacterium]
MARAAARGGERAMSRPPVATVTLDAFWGALFPDGDGFIELRALPSKDRDFFPSDDLAGIESFLGTHLAENLYFGVAARVAPGDGSLAGCGRLVVLFADIDFKTTPESGATARLERFPLQPSIVVKSGGGWHLYWLLREPADLRVNGEAARIKGLLRRLAIALGGDLAAAEPARVLRVPGTLNQKYTPPREVLVERFDAIFGFNLSDFDDLLPSEPPGDGDGASPFRMPQELPDGTRNPNLYRLGRSLR